MTVTPRSIQDNVELVGEYKPTAFKFKGHKPGVKPEDLR